MREPNPLALAQARLAGRYTYSPYSGYSVGVALIAMEIGNPVAKIFHGTNIENAAYGLTICAERVAVFSALAEGYDQFIELVCMTKDGGSSCGACRQVMLEFSRDMNLFFVQEDGYVTLKTTPIELLPAPFILEEN
jgi:cytidine deaminase